MATWLADSSMKYDKKTGNPAMPLAPAQYAFKLLRLGNVLARRVQPTTTQNTNCFLTLLLLGDAMHIQSLNPSYPAWTVVPPPWMRSLAGLLTAAAAPPSSRQLPPPVHAARPDGVPAQHPLAGVLPAARPCHPEMTQR